MSVTALVLCEDNIDANAKVYTVTRAPTHCSDDSQFKVLDSKNGIVIGHVHGGWNHPYRYHLVIMKTDFGSKPPSTT